MNGQQLRSDDQLSHPPWGHGCPTTLAKRPDAGARAKVLKILVIRPNAGRLTVAGRAQIFLS